MRRPIQTLCGDGVIRREDGSLIGRRQYVLTHWRLFHDDGHGLAPGRSLITGYIHLEAHEGLSFAAGSTELTLELEDGRQLPFSFTNTSGLIAPRGELK